MPLKKSSVAGVSTSGPLPSSWGGSCLSQFSFLMEFLFCASWEDGSKRELGTLQLSFSQGSVQIKLKDPGMKVYAFFAGDSLDIALMIADEALKDGKGDWRKDEWAGKRAAGK